MVKYKAVKETHSQHDIGEYASWGIEGVLCPDGHLGATAVYISDVFLNENDAVDFANLCTDMDLSLMHLPEVVEDFLCR